MAKYIQFIEAPDETFDGKSVFNIVNKRSGIEIGRIGWYPRWLTYVAVFTQGSAWSDDCLTDVAEFMAQIPKGERRCE